MSPDACGRPSRPPLGAAARLLLIAALALPGCGTDTSPEARIRSLKGIVQREGDTVRVVLTGWKGKEEDYALVAQVPGVTELFLAQREGAAPVTDRTLQALAPLTGLRELDLDGTAVTDNGLKVLTGMTALAVLHLERTAVTGGGLDTLGALPKLQHLYLKGARVSDGDAARWAGQHPQCQLHR